MPTSKPDDDDVGDMWRDHHLARQAKRGQNRATSTDLLRAKGVSFELRNGGAHMMIVTADTLRIDFWPGTGKFIVHRPEKLEGRGVFKLIQTLQRLNYDFQPPKDANVTHKAI